MAGYIGNKAAFLSSTSGADIDGNVTIDGDLTVSGNTVTIDSAQAQEIRLGDNDRMTFGDATGGDLQIYHDGFNSYISEVGTGDLYVRGSNFYITKPDGSLYFSGSNSTGEAGVYFNNSRKLATTSTGVDITGTLTSDDIQLDAGSGNNTQIINYRSTDMIFGNDGSEDMRLTNSGRLGIGTSSPAGVLSLEANNPNIRFDDTDTSNNAEITLDNTSLRIEVDEDNALANSAIKFRIDATERMRIDSSGNVGIGAASPSSTFRASIYGDGSSIIGGVEFRNAAAGGSTFTIGHASATSPSATLNVTDAANLIFKTDDTERMRIASTGELLVGTTSDTMPAAAAAGQAIMAGTRAFIATETGGDTILGGTTGSNFTAFYQGGTERMRIDISGNLLVGKSSASNDVTTAGQLFFPAGKSVITNNGDAAQNLVLAHYNSTGSPIAIEFYRNSTVVGNITKSSSGTTYNTTSDRRLKDNIEPIADGTEKLMAMKPVTHTWKADPNTGETVHGFIAQEMQEIVPEAVSGDPDGEEMMSMDYGRITPVLVAALQDAHKKIEALEERLAELEAK